MTWKQNMLENKLEKAIHKSVARPPAKINKSFQQERARHRTGPSVSILRFIMFLRH